MLSTILNQTSTNLNGNPLGWVEHFSLNIPLWGGQAAIAQQPSSSEFADHILEQHTETLTALDASGADFQCSICLGSAAANVVRTGVCGHLFHKDCLHRWLLIDAGHRCPMCRARLCPGDDNGSEGSEDDDGGSVA